MWEEAEDLTGYLQMFFFYTRGNHDISFPGARRRGSNATDPTITTLSTVTR